MMRLAREPLVDQHQKVLVGDMEFIRLFATRQNTPRPFYIKTTENVETTRRL